MWLMAYCSAALTSLSDNVSYIKYLFSESQKDTEATIRIQDAIHRFHDTVLVFLVRYGHLIWGITLRVSQLPIIKFLV